MIKNPVPISPDRHAGKCWLPSPSYAFAAGEALVPLVGAELSKAALSMPVAFTEHRDGLIPVAVMGLEPGRNLCVLPDGRWAVRYVPAAVRGYPFALGRTPAGGEPVLCIDEASGLVGEVGEPLFDDQRRPSPALARVIEFMGEVERNRVATLAACAALARHGVIVPWNLKVRQGDGEKAVGGLHRIDEERLNRLPDAAFLELRAAGALAIAYAHLLSLGQTALLGHIAGMQAPAAPAPVAGPVGEADFDQLRGMTFEF